MHYLGLMFLELVYMIYRMFQYNKKKLKYIFAFFVINNFLYFSERDFIMEGGDKRYFETEDHVKLYISSRPTIPASVISTIKQYLQEKR